MKKRSHLWQYLRDYRLNSILIKSFLVVFILIALLLSIITAIVYNAMNSIIDEEMGTISINSLYKTRDRIEVVLQDIERLAAQLSLIENVNVFMLSNESDYFRENIYSSVTETIRMYTGVFSYIDSVYIYSSKRQFIVSNRDSGSVQTYEDMTWYESYERNRDESAWTQIRRRKNTYPYFVSYIRPVKLNGIEPLGAIVINVDVEKLEKLVANSARKTADNVVIVDNEGRIIFSIDHSLLMQPIHQIELYKDIPRENGELYKIMGEQKQEWMVSVVSSEYYPWKFISVIPLSAYEQRLQKMAGFLFNFVIFSALFALVVAILLSIQTYNPVRNILSLLKDPDQWVEGRNGTINHGKDEIKDIALRIVRMVYSNKMLEKEIKDYMTMMDKAQMTALQAQINPHFLYNTLETIRWMAMSMSKGDNPVSQVVLTLSELLRMSLDNEQQVVTIEEEVQCAKLYVSILMLRYQEKLEVFWEIDESVMKSQTIKISLQPIIENAVYHGIKPLRKMGKVCISISLAEDCVLMKVSDNGVGISPDKVDQLNKAMKEKYLLSSEHIGMQNVNQRIKLFFGEDYGVSVDSGLQSETAVLIKLPRSDTAGMG